MPQPSVKPPTRLKVGYVVTTYPKLSETFVLNEILGLEKSGVQVSIFSIWTGNDPRFHPGISQVRADVYYLPQPGSIGVMDSLKAMFELQAPNYRAGLERAFDFAARLPIEVGGARLGQALRLAVTAAELRLEHLHAHFMLGSAHVAYMAHLITGIPFTVTAHAVDVYTGSIDEDAFSEIARAAYSLVTVCDANLDYIVSRYLQHDQGRVVRIYNGLPLDEIRSNGGKPRNPGLIFGAGRLVEKKGWSVLLDACHLLKKRGCSFTCVIAGSGSQGPGLVEQCRQLGLEGQVSFVGALRREEVLHWMSVARVLAAPCVTAANGDQDALPTVILEALALGLPVVSSGIAGISEIFDDGVEGLMVEEQDHKGLADALEALLNDDPLWSALSEAGPLKAERCFDQKQTLPQLLGLFQEAVAGRTSSSGTCR